MKIVKVPKIIVQRKAALGDVILATPIIRELHQRYRGKCEISVVTDNPDVFKNNPYCTVVNGNITPDVYFNLDNVYEMNPAMHITDAYAEYVFGDSKELGILSPELYETPADIAKVEQTLVDLNLQEKNYVVIHMRKHSWGNRNLPVDFYQKLISELADKTDFDIVQVGNPSEIAFEGHDRLHNCLGRFSLHEQKVLIQKAACFVGIDAGPLHIAACTTTPIISMFTSASHAYRKPIRAYATFVPIPANVDCYGCQATFPAPYNQPLCKTNDYRCVNSFDAAEIVQNLVNLKLTIPV